jgi:7-carboxy-7-deazaguanine synthase
MDKELRVRSVFNSIDGEANGFGGAGDLTTFIRLQGCNLRCLFCDTTYSNEIDDPTAEVMAIEDITEWPDLLEKVTITGGEPLLQDGTADLIIALLEEGHKVSVETNGSMLLPDIRTLPSHLPHKQLRWIVDYKLPASGVEKHMNPKVFEQMRKCDVLKFVISNYAEFYIARELVMEHPEWKAKMVFSPAVEDQYHFYEGWPKQLAELMVMDAKELGDIQYSLQVHKVLWPYATTEK